MESLRTCIPDADARNTRARRSRHDAWGKQGLVSRAGPSRGADTGNPCDAIGVAEAIPAWYSCPECQTSSATVLTCLRCRPWPTRALAEIALDSVGKKTHGC